MYHLTKQIFNDLSRTYSAWYPQLLKQYVLGKPQVPACIRPWAPLLVQSSFASSPACSVQEKNMGHFPLAKFSPELSTYTHNQNKRLNIAQINFPPNVLEPVSIPPMGDQTLHASL